MADKKTKDTNGNDQPKAKTPTHPVSTHDIAPAPTEPTTMSDAEIAEANADDGSTVAMSDESEIPVPEVDAKAAKKQAAAEKKIAQAKADLKAVKEELAPETLTLDDVADTSETEAQQDFSWDVKPNFQTMDEAGIKQYMKELTQWLRNRDAVVRGPTVTEEEVEDTSVATVTREGSQAPGSAKKQTTTVYEGFYEWEYKGNPPITIRRTHVTHFDALRDTADDAVRRRYET